MIWRLSSRPEGTAFFTSVLRTNLYVLVLVLAVPAAIMLPKRLTSPDFLAKRTQQVVAEAAPGRTIDKPAWHFVAERRTGGWQPVCRGLVEWVDHADPKVLLARIQVFRQDLL